MTKTTKRHLPALTPEQIAAQYAAGGEARTAAVAAFEQIVARAETGDREAFRQVYVAAEGVPALLYSRPVHQATEDQYLALLGGKDRLVTRHLLRQQVEALRAGLAGDHSSPLERLLVDRVVLCWLDSQLADVTLADKLSHSLPLSQAEYYQRRAERAQRRYLDAAKTLATVRRRLVPVIQLNVADKQVNIAGQAVPTRNVPATPTGQPLPAPTTILDS